MALLPHEGRAQPAAEAKSPPGGLDRWLRIFSLLTMAMTVPQVVAVWTGEGASGVSPLSWGTYLIASCLWFVHGLRLKDKSIYLACIGWIALDAAIVAGVLLRG
jgi:uncharacterized protein with PQ loop repeat